MCGIVGLVHRDAARPVPESLIRTMCDAIRHRGPDSDGVFVDGPVGLGMRRLSIIDVSGGRQPIFNEDGNLAIVFNGEIYNYRGLRDELIQKGHAFRTHSDTETILHLYEEEGPACVTRLRGMFTFAIWDRRARRLFLARDRFGIKPLYVAEGAWGLAFASELKALVCGGLTARRVDWDAMDMFFNMAYVPSPASAFTDVRKLEAAHTLTWANGTATVARYWAHPRERHPAPADPATRINEWLDASVKDHLVSDVPVAAFLSGGLDSSAVVASMAGFQETPHAFTARYHGTGAAAHDETGVATALTSRYGARHTLVEVQPDVTDILEKIVWSLDEPLADDSLIPTWILSSAVAREYKVALTGIGGDELFGGYPRHVGLMLGERYRRLPSGLRRLTAAVARRLPEPRWAGAKVNHLKRFAGSEAESVPQRYVEYVRRISSARRQALYAGPLAAGLRANPTIANWERVYEEGGKPTGFNAGLYLDARTFLTDDVLALNDRLSMAHSLEVRVPLVDHKMVEAIYPLPDRLKTGWPIKNKRLFREALRHRLPAEHMTAPKRGFVGPTAEWLRTELRPMLEDELSAARLKRLGCLQPGTVQTLLREHMERQHNHEGILLALLCFSTWHRLYVEAPLPPPYAVR